MGTNQVYHDLCKEIDILETRIGELEAEYKFWYKACFGGNTRKQFPLDICLTRMKEICDHVEIYVTLLDRKEQTREKIESRMADINKLENKVAYMRDVEGKSLAEIAADLNFSYSWVKKLSMRTAIKKEPRGNHGVENL